MTPSGIKPATFGPSSQCLNKLQHRVAAVHGMRDVKWAYVMWRLSRLGVQTFAAVATIATVATVATVAN